jgi:prevent-host-death family protein
MITVTIDDIKQDLAGYLLRVQAGETVVIVEADQPIAELKSPNTQRLSESHQPRPFGLCRGDFTVPDDFDAPLPEEILIQFEG